ncbi:type II secretion system protein J [Thiomicrorhabdus immobilis]|uniref:Type II secretion system protein J n=1 Tax=Thiomicrorhabdus immobilis TaxID=2791037 RepID=A0ABN6D2V8_9GAMM|nr:type II secretion system minor pseudopilin GspJ [Thiomicrorhabdus immobilis]BCN94324.1 type II secretion system protein J [Thiomicrorhabdus immobilis]
MNSQSRYVSQAMRSSEMKLQQGFTLIELLVALGVSAVIAVLAYQSIDSMVNVKTTVEQHSKQNENLQRAIWWMEQDFIQIVPRAIQDELGSRQAAFKYREDIGIEFTRIAQFPTPNASGGLLRVGYQLQDGILYRLTWPVLDRAQDTKPKKVELLTDIEGFDIELLTSSNEWVKDWPRANLGLTDLPRASRVTIKHKTLGTITRLFMGID